MNRVDRFLQRWRIAKVRPLIPQRARVLDVGSADGELFQHVPGIAEGVGIDPRIDSDQVHDGYRLIRGWFPEDPTDDQPFDVITMLAVLEHIPTDKQPQLAENCVALLKPGGLLLITVPAPVVDKILAVLRFLRVVDGQALDEHYGFDVARTPKLFTKAGLQLLCHHRFELGLNHLFAFRKAVQDEQAV